MNSNFPQYTETSRRGERGVGVVSRIFADKFGWIFKRNHLEHDFGIDGQAEIVTSGGDVTGSILAVQIKCGESYFREKNERGYVYRGEKKHFNYLLNYPMPVLLCLCDPYSETTYWVQFDPTVARPTQSGWVVTVPFENVLSASKDHLLSIAGGVVVGADELEEYWHLNELVCSHYHIHYMFDRIDVEDGDVTNARLFFDRLLSTNELTTKTRGKVEFVFFGYDKDPRELYEITDVRAFVRMLDRALPELLFFVRNQQPTYTLMLLLLCNSPVQSIDGSMTKTRQRRIDLDPRDIMEFIMDRTHHFNQIAERVGVPMDEQKAMWFRICQCLGLNFSEQNEKQ